MISNSFNIILLLLISLFLNKVLLACVFLFTFIVGRLLCGGFHANTHLSCFLLTQSNNLLFLLIVCITKGSYIPYITIFLSAFSTITILLLAPIEHENNPISQKIKKKCRFLSIFLILFIDILTLVMLVSHIALKGVLSMNIGIFLVSISLLISFIKKHLKKEATFHEKST